MERDDERTMLRISARARREVIESIRVRYLNGSISEKRRILDSFVELIGCNRKHAIRVLRERASEPAPRSGRPRIYDDAVRAALAALWIASGHRCGKRLRPMLPRLIRALEADGTLSIDSAVRSRLLAISAATIDRLLAGERDARGAGRRVRASALDPPAGEALVPVPRAEAGPPRAWRTRPDPFHAVWSQVVSWLEVDPDQPANRQLERLRREGHDELSTRQLRTLQRRIQAWRRSRAATHDHNGSDQI